MDDPEEYLGSLDGTRWDGREASATDIDLASGGVVLYDMSTTESSARVSVFIASGARVADIEYSGPSEVYTCYVMNAAFRVGKRPAVDREILTECPEPLVQLLADDAAFATGDVFDG